MSSYETVHNTEDQVLMSTMQEKDGRGGSERVIVFEKQAIPLQFSYYIYTMNSYSLL